MIYRKGYCDSCDTDNCEHANPLRLGRVDQTPQQAAIIAALDSQQARIAELEKALDGSERNLESTVKALSPELGVRVERFIDGRATRCWFGLSVFWKLFVPLPAPPTPESE